MLCCVVLRVVISVGPLGFESRRVTGVTQSGSRWDLFPVVVGRHPAPLGRAVFVGAVGGCVAEVAFFLVGVVEYYASVGRGGGGVVVSGVVVALRGKG